MILSDFLKNFWAGASVTVFDAARSKFGMRSMWVMDIKIVKVDIRCIVHVYDTRYRMYLGAQTATRSIRFAIG